MNAFNQTTKSQGSEEIPNVIYLPWSQTRKINSGNNGSSDDFVIMDFTDPEDFILIKNPEIKALTVQPRDKQGSS